MTTQPIQQDFQIWNFGKQSNKELIIFAEQIYRDMFIKERILQYSGILMECPEGNPLTTHLILMTFWENAETGSPELLNNNEGMGP